MTAVVREIEMAVMMVALRVGNWVYHLVAKWAKA